MTAWQIWPSGPRVALQQKNLGALDVIGRYNRWQYFGSCTFSGMEPSLDVGRKLVFAHLYRAADMLRVPFRRLVWVLRFEFGETFGRGHYHVLLGGSAINPTIGQCFTLNNEWDALPRCGSARHYVYNRKQHAIDYVADCLGYGDRTGADIYETTKFGSLDATLTLSHSLLRQVGGHWMFDRQRVNGNGSGNKSTRCERAKDAERLIQRWGLTSSQENVTPGCAPTIREVLTVNALERKLTAA